MVFRRSQNLQKKQKELFLGEVRKKTEALLEKEEDFQDLLEIVVEYLSTLDKEVEEDKVRLLLKKRMHLEKEKAFDLKDSDMQELNKVLRLTTL